MCITLCVYTCATSNEQETYIMTHEDCHNNFSMNKQQNHAKTNKLGRFAEPSIQFLKNTLSLTSFEYVQ